jgi:nicotinate-nucleotide adenylyltransferase
VRRAAILGGSFNPPHLGHQMICLWALSTEQVDEVWIVPCFAHPFRKQLQPFADRVAMCERAAAVLPVGRVRVSRVEEELGGESRTLYTIQHLVAQHPGTRFRLLIGADILAERAEWHRWGEIERLAPPIVIGRAGYESLLGGAAAAGAEVPVLPAISSTLIRERLARGEEVAALLPAAVLAYIRERGLYVTR